MKLWFVVYIIHVVVFSDHVSGDDMSQCTRRIEAAQALLASIAPAEPVNVNIAPQNRKKQDQPEQTMYCMWSEKDPKLK
jgi:hypothetical protein